MRETYWLEDFEETCQDIMEVTVLLDALSMYLIRGEDFSHVVRAAYVPLVSRRLCGYLSQHALDLHNLKRRLDPDLQQASKLLPSNRRDGL